MDGLDAAPIDSLCWAASDASNGVCYLRTLAGTHLKVVGNDQGKIFFSAEGDALMLYAYDLDTQHFLGRTVIKGYTPTTYAYLPDHARLYVGDTDGAIHAYTEALTEMAADFARIPLTVKGLAAAGNYLLAQDASGAWATHYLFDQSGKLTDSKDWNCYSSHYGWAPNQARIYFFRDDTSPNDLMFEEIDQATGKIKTSGESPYHGSYIIKGPIRVNRTGTKVMLGSGDIYAAPALTWSGKMAIAAAFSDAMWLDNDELIATHATGNGMQLIRYRIGQGVVEELRLNGEPMAIARQGTSIQLIIKTPTHVDIHKYVPSDDSDGDGVDNLTDSFPLDKTAAVDSDGDGYPDTWLNGQAAASPTGLTLDAYPLDASCHDAQQGDGFRCDPSLSMPNFIPERVFTDGQGTFFLFAATQNRIYRWSSNTGTYLPPVVVGRQTDNSLIAPKSIAYSSDHQRLYLGYESGLISYIDFSVDVKEKYFAAVSESVQGLADAGKYLLAQDASGAWATHYLFDQSGKLADSKDWNYYSSLYEWAPNQARIYFFRDGVSPNDLMFEEIDQATGKIKASGESPYHGSYIIKGPIRVSLDGTRIILGSANVYRTTDLTVIALLSISLVDMQWLADGSLVTISPSGQNTLLTVYSSAFAVISEQSVAGLSVAVERVSGGVAVFSHVNGRLQVTHLAI